MKVGDLVMIGGCGVGVLLEQQSKVCTRWVVHWFDDNDWTWEFEQDLEVISESR